jgi:hypothetical protein
VLGEAQKAGRPRFRRPVESSGYGGSVPAPDLPARWRHYPAPDGLAEVGTRWTQDARTAVLAVSCVIPTELTYLLNPRHPTFAKIRIGRPERFSFDPRMWK